MRRDSVVVGDPVRNLFQHACGGRAIGPRYVVAAQRVHIDSDIPFDCGLAAGLVIGTKCSHSAVQSISSAV